jgi:hypothetical protein
VVVSWAKVLDEHLSRGPLLAQRFFAEVAKVVSNPWEIATGEDLRFPQVEGAHPPGTALIHRYMVRAHRATQKDPVVLRRFFEVVNLLAPPTAMLAPGIVWRVLFGGFGAPQSTPALKEAGRPVAVEMG